MKVLHAAETIRGGIASVIRVLSLGMLSSGQATQVICLVPDSQANDLVDLPKPCIRTFPSAVRGIATCLSFSIALFKAACEQRPDVVHLHSTFAGALGRIALFLARPIHRCRVIYSPHAFAFTMQVPSWKQRIYALVERLLLHITDQLICTCQYELDEAIKFGLDRGKLHLVHNGVPTPEECSIFPLIRDTTTLNLLFVGRFDEQKGFDLLRKAMDVLSGDPIRLVAIGAAVHGEHVPESHPQIEYVGWVKHAQLPEFYRSAHVLVMPSRWEGFAMTPLEAISYGLPVLASSHGSFDEVVIPGISGDRFPTDDAQALAERIRRLSPSDCLSMRASSRQHFIDHFKDSQMIDATAELYLAHVQPAPGVCG
ncbi:glycosyltransferase [[Pseudomonas] boreopolis]|uniref:glycosyltransferase n=1 Tax=Xanthomonas boreopolis TaxID=86183 RepID=UPI003DA04573